MKYIKSLVLLIAVLSAHCAVMAQDKKIKDTHLTGHVLDAETGEHIPYATIVIMGTSKGAITDASGHYIITGLGVGKYKLEASFTGYKSKIQSIEVKRSQTLELNFELDLEPMIVEDIVVSSTRNVTKRKESPTVVGVMSNKQFEITSSKNVAEALNFQSGLRVDYNCANCGVPQLRINGLEGQYSQILLDSRPIFSSLSAVYGLEQMPAGMIERVEVIRGGGSALFGSNAIGGVVNIITKEPVGNSLLLSNTTSVMEGGTLDVNTTLNGSFISSDNKFGMYLFSMLRDREHYDRDGDGFSEIPELSSKTVGFRGFYRTSKNSKITAEYHNMGEFRRGGDLFEQPPHESNIAEQLKHNINGGGLKYDIFTSDYKHRVNIYLSAQKIDRESYFGTNQNPDAYGKSDDMTVVGGAQYTYNMKRFLFMPSELTVGGEYNFNRLHDKMLGYNRDITQRSIIYGGYLQNEWKNEKLSILLGVRLDKHNKVGNMIFSPRANIRYSPHKEVILRASYSSGYRAPQAYDEDLHVAAVGGKVSLIVLDPNLKPEYSNSVSGSVDLYRTFGHYTANLLIEGFYTKLKDVFALEEMGTDEHGNMLLQRRNASGMKIAGVNFEGRVNYKSIFNIQAGFTYQRSHYDEPRRWSESESIAPQRRLLRSPDTYGYLSAGWNITKKLSFSANGTYTGTMLVPHFRADGGDREVNTESFWDIGTKVAYNFKLTKYLKFELSCGVKNILDSYQKNMDIGVDKDSKFIYGPNAPRTYFVGAKFTL